ncbi:MAG: DegT/DnrJ/EryC1/StrS family aminotransferase [Dehalococcoidia bacterium]
MPIPLVDLKKQCQSIKQEVLAEIGQVLDGMQLFLGKNVQALESNFAAYCGAKFAIGVGSGTDALHVALRACGIGPGDEVITVSHTFIATVEAIILAGAKPVLVDIDAETYNMDPYQVGKRITNKTRAIIPVHLYGHPANMGPLLELARNYKLKVIEDACQAHGAEYEGRRTGSLGDIGCFSFYCTKNLGGYGEGGIITTSDPELAKLCRMLRDHGQNTKYYHSMIGMNARLDEIQAAVLNVKMPHLADWTEKRRSIARVYNENLPADIIKPREMPWARHVYHVYCVRSSNREQLREWLGKKGVNCGMHYPVPVHLQDAWRNYGGENCSLPVTEKIVGEILSLPMYPEMTDEEVNYVCESIQEFADFRLDLVGNTIK